MSVTIVSPGLLSTLQDLGRTGYQETGFSPSGVLDQKAMKIANLLVNNPIDEAVIEMTFMGATMEFNTANVISVTGGDFNPKLNNVTFPMYKAQAVHPGDKLELGYAKSGCRAYVAFAGGLDVPKVLGSKSTNLKCGIGGFYGRRLMVGDCISFASPKDTLPALSKKIVAYEKDWEHKETVRVVLGPQVDYFTEEGIDIFRKEAYTITNDSDRMGCKLEGKPISYKSKVDIISDGIPLGGIQIPPNGKPIVMLADRQTTGGYAKIGTIISVDIPFFVQKKPGDVVRFEAVSIEHAQRLYKKEYRKLEKLRIKLLR
jgi:biotin-dependent carboxylase-like uncharacterized protein